MAIVALAFGACLSAASSWQAGSPASSNGARESFDDLYLRGTETAAGITTLTARFKETTTSSLLTRPLVAYGTLAVQRPSRVVLRFTDPEERLVLIDGDRMSLVWPSRDLRQVSNVASSQKRIQKYVAGGSAAELRRQFDVNLHDRSDRPDSYQVTLIPKQKQVRETLTRLDLWVQRTSFLLSAIQMTFASGDTKMMEFENVAPNVALDPDIFSVGR